MDSKTFSETDIQDYLDGNFEGDQQAIQFFVQSNSQASKFYEEYKILYAGLKQAGSIEITNSIADKVIKTIILKKEQREKRNVTLLLLFLTLTGVVAMAYAVRPDQLVHTETGYAVVVSSVIMGIFVTIFYKTEMRRKERLFSLFQAKMFEQAP